MSKKQLIADYDSEDDQDYVPTAKELQKAGVSFPDEPKEDKQLTGIALVRDLKRQREVDDIFAMMNEEDNYTSKRQKVDQTTKAVLVRPPEVDKPKEKGDITR